MSHDRHDNITGSGTVFSAIVATWTIGFSKLSHLSMHDRVITHFAVSIMGRLGVIGSLIIVTILTIDCPRIANPRERNDVYP